MRSNGLVGPCLWPAVMGFAAISATVAADSQSGENFSNPQAVQQVQSGQTDTANAAWWGFNPADSTAALQGAIDSGAKVVVIPYMAADWVVGPIFLRSDQEIRFDPGVVVTAKPGAFRGLYDALLSGSRVSNIKITGYGAILRMRKSDYTSSDYQQSEWRHALALYGARNAEVNGLSLHSSGGDGLYIGATREPPRAPSENVTVRDCVCNDNLRQGMSIISARNVVVEGCTFRNTSGTAPQAGLDVEPSFPGDIVSNVEVRNCVAINNRGSGFFTNLSKLDGTSPVVSLRFVNCIVRNSRQPGLRVVMSEGSLAAGSVEFDTCGAEGTDYAGTSVKWNAGAPMTLTFKDCKWRDVARRSSEPPIYIELEGASAGQAGNIQFDNCYLYDEKSRVPVQAVLQGNSESLVVNGMIHYINPSIDSDIQVNELPDLSVSHKKRQN